MTRLPTLIAVFLMLILWIGWFSGSAALYAGVSGKLAGKVTDAQTGQALVGVNIVIEELQTGGSSDAEGDYYILNLHPGTYTVSFSYLGYQTVSKTGILVIANRTIRVDAKLTPAVIEGAAVTVVGQRDIIERDLTASEQVVTGEEMQRSWIRTLPELLETQVGIFQGTFRGSSDLQAVYLLDNLSVNSGLLSDNYTSFNLTAIQELSVLTGGYNAEYGEARSAVINVVEKETVSGIHGSFLTRMRPAGIYHFGDYIYGRDNFDYTNYDLEYWTAQANDPLGRFYGAAPDSLLAAWRRQITPNDSLGKYDQRPELESEATLFGAITPRLSFLVSGRFKRGVGIYPQAIPYNPEHNVQGYLNYKISDHLKLRLGGFLGGWESADFLSVNFNSLESAQESAWLIPMRVSQPYSRHKYNPMGTIYLQWPELRRWRQLYLKLSHVLNSSTYYEVTASYLRDRMDRSDRYNTVPDSLYSRRDDEFMMVDRYVKQGYFHAWDQTTSSVFQVKGDFTSQYTKYHLIKAGFGFKQNDFDYLHFMGVHEGGARWNLVNLFNGRPYEGHFYLQDKIEFPGLIINAGLRMDYFHQNRKAAKNMFDPLAFETTTPGHDPSEPLGYPGTPEREATKLQKAFAPRLGLSHPISEHSVLHFSYGHFYQRPSWTKMFGLPYVNYTDSDSAALDPYGNQLTYMEEWHGWYGNPKMTYERTVQYELGIDYDIARRYKLDLTGYYKDGSNEASVITGVYGAEYNTTKALMISNSGYSDVRGVEASLNSHLPGPLNYGLSYDIFWSSQGEVGFSRLYEPGSELVNVPKGQRQGESVWNNYHKIKLNLNFSFPRNGGPRLLGLKPLSDVNLAAYFWWRSGDPYTYHSPGDVSTRQNNRRWFSYHQLNLKAAKGFDLLKVRGELSLDVRNVLNRKFLRRLYGDDLIRWHENPGLPDEGRLPRNSFSAEPDVWNWYSYEVPPRQVYFQFKIDF